jgi:hypothetical protein
MSQNKIFNTVFDEFHLVTETSSAATKLKFIKKSVHISPINVQHKNVGECSKKFMDRGHESL